MHTLDVFYLPLNSPPPAVQMPEIHLDPFRTCIFSASETAEWAYRSQVAFAGICYFLSRRYLGRSHSTDLVTFVCIIVFVLKLKAKHGRPHMSRLMRTILQDGVMYFFVMATFHIAIAFFTFFIPVILFLPPCERWI